MQTEISGKHNSPPYFVLLFLFFSITLPPVRINFTNPGLPERSGPSSPSLACGRGFAFTSISFYFQSEPRCLFQLSLPNVYMEQLHEQNIAYIIFTKNRYISVRP